MTASGAVTEVSAIHRRGRASCSSVPLPWPLCFAGEGDDGLPLTEVWCSSWPGTGSADYSVAIRGELCEHSAARLAPALASLESTAPNVVLDLTDVSVVDHAGLALIHETIARYVVAGGTCTITATSPTYDRAERTNHRPDRTDPVTPLERPD